MKKIPVPLSIVIPVYNAEKHLEQTLQLLDTYFTEHADNFEMVLVDDGSRDASPQILRRWSEGHPNRIVSFNKKNIGQDRSNLKGVQLSKGEWVMVIDDDFDYTIDSLQKMFDKMSENKYDLVYGIPQYPKRDHFRRITSNWSHRIAAWMGFTDSTNYKLLRGPLLEQTRKASDSKMFNIDKFLMAQKPSVGYINAPNFPYEHSRFSIYKLLVKFFNFIFYNK